MQDAGGVALGSREASVRKGQWTEACRLWVPGRSLRSCPWSPPDWTLHILWHTSGDTGPRLPGHQHLLAPLPRWPLLLGLPTPTPTMPVPGFSLDPFSAYTAFP